MPDYAYKATDAAGVITKGTRFANNPEELATLVRSSGLHLLEYREAKTQQFLKALQEIQVGGLSRRDLIDFSQNMGVMFRAGVPLISALDELRQDVESKALKKILGEVIQDIEAGDSLSEAMAKRPKAFPPLYTNVVQIGEGTGSLDQIFFDLTKHYKRIDDLVKNVRKAMVYPIVVVIVLILAGYVFLTMVFPPLFELLEGFKVPLPLITRVVMAVSTTIQHQGHFLLIGVIVLIVAYIIARRNPKSRYYLDLTALNLPWLKGVFIQLRLAFFMRYLSMLLAAGMDILQGLKLSTDSVNNLVIQRYLRESRDRVLEGELLSESLRHIRYIPNMVARMIAIGEEAGNLPEQMEYVADVYNEELERRIAMALALLEPALIIAMAGVAMALVMGVLLPLYNLVSQLSTQAGGG